MSRPLLSILIPTVVGREDSFQSLYTDFQYQIKRHSYESNVEILFLKDNKEMTIGEKRERLYQMANGLYSVQWDDDDAIAQEGLQDILFAIMNGNPDCITYFEDVKIDGKEFLSNHSIHYSDWEGDGSKLLWDGCHFHRTPFMKSVIKTEIAKSVPIPKCRFSEDHQWSILLKPHLKTETHIQHSIYYYQHTSSEFNDRYGINRGA